MNQFVVFLTVILIVLPLSSSADQDAGLRLMLASGEAKVQNVDPLSKAKALVAQYAYTYRPKMNVEAMLHVMEKEWKAKREGEWAAFDHATYVDMQRIVRRAYRKNAGKFRHQCCERDVIIEQMRREYWGCKSSGY